MNKWIKCSERLPPEGQKVLICDSCTASVTGAFLRPGNADWFVIVDFDEYEQEVRTKNISHWMPIPPLPQNDCDCPICDEQTKQILNETYWKVENEKI